MVWPRALPAALAVAVLMGGCASGDGSPADLDRQQSAAPATAPPTTEAPTTTTAPPPPTTTTTLPPPPEPEVLEAGIAGPRTLAVQQRLADLRYDPGPLDGEFGSKTTMAIWAFQKLNGLPVDGRVTPDVWNLMQAAAPPAPVRPDGAPDRVEIDLGRQVLLLYDQGALRLITHISTGTRVPFCENGYCGNAVTPAGDFRFQRRIAGWRESPLGKLYNPIYFVGGIAVHGAPSVPAQPASHGCVRIPMHIAQYFPDLVANGDPVHVV